MSERTYHIVRDGKLLREITCSHRVAMDEAKAASAERNGFIVLWDKLRVVRFGMFCNGKQF